MFTFTFQRHGLLAPAPAVSPRSDEALQGRLARARLSRVLRVAPEAFPAGIGAVCLMVLTMGMDGPADGFVLSGKAAVWALAMVAVLAHGQWLRRRMGRAASADGAIVAAGLRRVTAQAAALGAAWGSAAWLLLPAATEARLSLLVFALAAVLIAGLHVYRTLRAAATGFGAAFIAVFGAGLLRAGEAVPLAVAAGFGLCAAVVLVTARREQRMAAEAIELAMQHDDLVAERTAHREALEDARERTGEALARAEELQQDCSGFVATVGRDLRQPMHAVMQHTQHLRRMHGDPDADATVGRIAEAVSGMSDRLDTLVDHARLAAGEIRVRSETVNLGRLFDRLEAHLRPLAEARGLALHIESRAGDVRGDPVLIERALRHIAHNALRFTPRGAVTIRAVSRGASTRILVADSGIGIAPAERHRIAEAASRATLGAGPSGTGPGLGLAIVQTLARLMGTSIRLRSLPGRGSTFALTLPTIATAAAPLQAGRGRAEAGGVRGTFVVLIESDPLALDGIAGTLRGFGCRVLEAASGLEALHALARAEFVPQLVIADFRLGEAAGGGSGAEAIRMVVENQAALYGSEFRLPALLVSSETSAGEMRQLQAAGYPMLHKSAGRERLHARIRAMLAGASAAAGRV